MAIVYGESHLIAASLPSLLFPVFGFIGACIQVRYKGDYTTCLAANNRTLEDDQLLINLRMIQSLFYAYSISYFFLLVNADYSRVFNIINGVIFTLLNLCVFACAIYGFVVLGASSCAEGGYGGVLWFMNVSGLVFVLIELIITMWLFFGFRSTGKLPLFGGKDD